MYTVTHSRGYYLAGDQTSSSPKWLEKVLWAPPGAAAVHGGDAEVSGEKSELQGQEGGATGLGGLKVRTIHSFRRKTGAGLFIPSVSELHRKDLLSAYRVPVSDFYGARSSQKTNNDQEKFKEHDQKRT